MCAACLGRSRHQKALQKISTLPALSTLPCCLLPLPSQLFEFWKRVHLEATRGAAHVNGELFLSSEAPAFRCQAQSPGWMPRRAVSCSALCCSYLDLLNGLSLGLVSKLKPSGSNSGQREDSESHRTVPQGITMSLTDGGDDRPGLFQLLSTVCTSALQEELGRCVSCRWDWC